MTKKETIEILQLFIEKADKLLSSNFVKNVESGSGVNFTLKQGKTPSIKRWGPDQENIEAFVLTFRFFIQNNEKISISNLTKVFDSPFVTAEEKASFEKARQFLNSYLDGNTMFDIRGRIQRRVLMDTFIYGGLSHANREKKITYDSWVNDPLLSSLIVNEFIVILFETLNAIGYFGNLSVQLLERIKT